MEQLPQERLIIACRAWRRWSALDETLAYVKERKAFGKPCGPSRTRASSWPNAGHGAGHARLRRRLHGARTCRASSTPRRAALAKYWVTECSAG
jgi:acyl-CoA dehydrogenase